MSAPGGSSFERLATIERYYPAFPSLADSKRFLELRTTIGLDAFARCLDATNGAKQCRDDLERFVRIAPVSAALAQGAASLIGTKFNRQAASLFIIPGLDAPDGTALCMDSELASYVVAGFGLSPDYREAKAARAIAERCWESLKTEIAANVARVTDASYYLQNACPSLIQHKALAGLREKRCQAVVRP